MRHNLTPAALAGLALLLGGFTLPPLPVPKEAAVIYNPGNVAFTGFRIVVQPSGTTASADATGKMNGQLPASLASTFFADLAAATPLSKLPTVLCDSTPNAAKSIIISWHGDRSPDLGCAGSPQGAALFADAQAIARQLYVAAYRTGSVPMMGTGGPGPSVPSAGSSASQPPPSNPNPYPGGYPH